MKDRKTVSVAMATYNGERYLREQLDSILNQTKKPEEIVVVDDCSKDRTYEILEDYRSRYPDTVKIYRNERNLGYIKNFERAISLCSSDYVALSDQDDIWAPEKIEELCAAIGDSLMIHSDAHISDADGNVIHESCSGLMRKNVRATLFTVLYVNHVTGCTMMIRRSVFALAYPFPEHLHHDWWLTLVSLSQGTAAYSPKKLLRYRQHGNNVIGCVGEYDEDNKTFKRAALSFVRKTYNFNYRRNKRVKAVYDSLTLLESRKLLESAKMKRFFEDVTALHDCYFTRGRVFCFRAFVIRIRNFWKLYQTDNERLFHHVMVALTSFFCPDWTGKTEALRNEKGR